MCVCVCACVCVCVCLFGCVFGVGWFGMGRLRVGWDGVSVCVVVCVEWSGVKRSGVEWSGVERKKEGEWASEWMNE